MGTIIRVDLIDDMDGKSEAAETVAFAVGSDRYEIDLSAAHAAEFRKTVAPFIAAGRSAGSTGLRSTTPGDRRNAETRRESAAVRKWAVHKRLVAAGSRGRLPAGVLAAYDRAHQ